MKKILANIALAAIVTLLCLAVAEAGLRALTPFPIHGEKANKIYDVDFGYRLNPAHPSIDANGFRNKGQKPRELAAIGDSHTYGSNVRAQEAWPEQFEQLTGIPVYNFGVGSYAVYAYYAIARRAIEDGYKNVIIALLIHNDFKVNGNSCDIDYAASPMWREAKAALGLRLPDCSGADNWQTACAPGFVRWFRGRADSAILSAIDYLVVAPLADQWHRLTHGKAKSAGLLVRAARASSTAPIKKRAASAYFAGRAIKNQEVEFAFTDLSRKAVTNGIEDFEKMLLDLKRRADAKGAHVGVMFIPSKVQLFYEYLDDLDIYAQVPVLEEMALNHQKIERRLSGFMTGNGVPWRSAKPELIEAIAASEREGTWVFPPGGGHPNPAGYTAYAKAANELYRQMSGK